MELKSENIRFEMQIRILMPDSIRDSIRTQTANSQVPTVNTCSDDQTDLYTAMQVIVGTVMNLYAGFYIGGASTPLPALFIPFRLSPS